MAILPGVPGLEIHIQSQQPNGFVDLPEYDDEDPWTYRKYGHLQENLRSSKYVESKEGAEFRIRLLLKHPFVITSHSVTFKASVDGHGIAQASCTADYFTRASGFYMELICARLDRVSPTEVSSRPLKFGSIKKVDDQDSNRVKSDMKAVAGLGEISISVFRTLQRDPILPPLNNYRQSPHTPVAEVAEKALKGKAISHGVQYGDQKIVTRHIKETVDVDGPNNPIGVFVFKYRSREDLQAELIIPRTPSPLSSSATSRSRNHLPADREARLAQLKQEMAVLKGEDDDDGIMTAPPSRKRRSESVVTGGRAYKVSRTPAGKDLVDLTDD